MDNRSQQNTQNLNFVRSVLSSPQFQQESQDQQQVVIETILSSGQVSYDDVNTILGQVSTKQSQKSRISRTSSISPQQSLRPGFEKLSNINDLYNDKLIVYILGAGPVGLLTAIKLIDVYQDKIRVVLFEKRAVYTRERVLFINNYVIHQLLPKQLLTNSKLVEFGCSFNALPGADLATCSPFETLEEVERLAISTRALEDSLKELLLTDEYNQYARFIIYDKIDKDYIEELNQKFTPHVFIGADAGALSFTLYSEQFGVTEKQDVNPIDPESTEPSRLTYGLVAQFIPDANDEAVRQCCAKFPKRQNRYRVFRQQMKQYPKFNNKEDLENDTPKQEFLAYYIAAQVNEAERNQIVKELGDKTFVRDYTLGTNSSSGKYLDRLIYDASFLYNFNLKPGRTFAEVSLFPISVVSLKPWQYSKIVQIANNDNQRSINNNNKTKKNIWFPYIGDAIMSFNFFSGGGVNAGFAEIEFILEALLTYISPVVEFVLPVLPDERTAGLIEQQGPLVRNITEFLSPNKTSKSPQEVFNDPNALAAMIEIYKNGIENELFGGSFDQGSDQRGIGRLIDANEFFSYLYYSDMILHCNGDPVDFNRLKLYQRANGIRMEEIDLDEEAFEGSQEDLHGIPGNHIYTKADDRTCLTTYGTWGPNGN